VSNAADLTAISDRLAIIDLVNRHVNDIDAKRWDRVGDFFSEDAFARWTPEKSMQGAGGIVGAMRQMLDTDEVVTYHDVGNFSPVISGDSAEADIRIRAMHHGEGRRAGRFYESLGIQKTRFARTPDGWRCNYYEWQIVVKLGSMDVFASEVSSSA
jgi:hypothetical protein